MTWRRHHLPFLLLACLLSKALPGALLAQTSLRAQPLPPAYQSSQDAAAEPPFASDEDQAPEPAPTASSPVEHLRRALHHLTAAGQKALAQQVRKALARADKKRQLQRKLQELAALKAEVEALRKELGVAEQVVLHLRVMELQNERMRKMGLDFQVASAPKAGPRPPTATAIVRAGKDAAQLLEALRSHRLVKVLAEPTLATVSGRRATFQSGGEFPIVVPHDDGRKAVEFRSFGTRIECLPEILDNGKIRLHLRPTISEIDAATSMRVGGAVVPGLRVRHFETAVELTPGETLLLAGPSLQTASESGKMPEKSLVLTVRAELTDAKQTQRLQPQQRR